MPGGHGQGGIGDETGGAVDVDAVITFEEEGVADLGQAGVEGNPASDGERELGFVSIGAAGSLEFEAAVIGEVDLRWSDRLS